MLRRIWVLLAALFLAAGCVETDDSGPGTGDDGPPTTLPGESWPGGSESEWGEGDSLEESWSRGEGSGADGEYGRGAGGGGGEYAGGMDGDSDGLSDTGGEPAPGDPSSPPQSGAGLEGGEVDDNDLFDDFLTYAEDALDRFGDDPMVHWVDVSRRHMIRVLDSNGNTVPDASIFIMDGETVVATGRSHSDGRFAFFPHAYGDPVDGYQIVVGAGDARGSASINENTDVVTIVLDGVRPDQSTCTLQIAFLIDATGSMGEEIDRIKDTLTSIVARVAETGDDVEIELAMVEYRDFGDDFVTHAVNFTSDVEAYQGAIQEVFAGGGGDGPEALNEALKDSFRGLDWSQDNTLRLAFLVADAPAHYYEQAPYTYDDGMLDAAAMGVTIYPIASGGSDGVAELQFRQLAQFTLGHFIFITEGGGSPHGSGGSEYEVDPEDFDVENLDDLVVRLINDELGAWKAVASNPL